MSRPAILAAVQEQSTEPPSPTPPILLVSVDSSVAAVIGERLAAVFVGASAAGGWRRSFRQEEFKAVDGRRFDAIVRTIGDVSTRRSLLQRGLSGSIGLILTAAGGLRSDGDVSLANRRPHRLGRNAHSERKSGGGGRGGNGGKGKGGKCLNELRQDGAQCGIGLVCAGGTCVAVCGGSTAPCADGLTCCAKACVDTTTNFSHCGACGHACNPDAASVCVAGVCQCGPNGKVCGARCVGLNTCCTDAECTGEEAGACVDGTCVPAFHICNYGGASSGFVTGGANPIASASSFRLSIGNDGRDAVHVNLDGFAGTLISDLETLDYTTFVPNGGLCGMAPYIVLLVETPLPPSPIQPFDILVYDPGADSGPSPVCGTVQTWHARNGKYRSIFRNVFADQQRPRTLDEYDAAFGPTRLYNLSEPTPLCPVSVGGLRIEVGHNNTEPDGGWQHFVGFVDSITIGVSGEPERTFDF